MGARPGELVAVVVIRRALLCTYVCFLLAGCDHFPGPPVRSEFPDTVKITINYDDGTTSSQLWQPCLNVQAGASEVGRFGMKARQTNIESITIEKNARVLLVVPESEIKSLYAKTEVSREYLYWVVRPDGIHLTADENCGLDVMR